MTRKTRPYRDLRLERLANPEVAAHYLNATMENSPNEFLAALKVVAKARQMAKVAKEAGVQRETLYRSLSEQGNPTWDTLSAVLGAVGIGVSFFPAELGPTPLETSPTIVVHKEVPSPSQNERPVNLLGNDDPPWSSVNPLWSGHANGFSPQEGLL